MSPMSIFKDGVMKENECSLFTKIGATIAFVVLPLVWALLNIRQGQVNNPAAFGVSLVGFLLFGIAKLLVIRQGRRISFGSKPMTERIGNLYRLGYWLVIVGILSTFA
jgi:hypothetical protein